ncbi:MAG: XrtB/PEP-CTERM-associated polysaccharide biosynthesis outer membrane protein EpsL [Pseudomonadota bacterium]
MSLLFPVHRRQLCALLLVVAAPVQAAPSDPLHLFAGIGYFHDDNLFRLADGQPGFDNRRGDSARYVSAGLLFDKTRGRQKLKLEGKLSKVKFGHFSQLDYDGKDFLGLLNWQLGNRWEGSAGGSYAQSLAPYTDLRSSERNLRVHKRVHGDAAWRLHPRWRLRAAGARVRYTYDLPAQRANNRTERALEAGFDYTPPSGSTAGLVLRRVKGRYLRPGDDFTQTELKAKVHWKLTPISSIELLAGHARRKHPGQGQRDAKGFNGKVTASVNPRQKLRLNAAAWREFAPIESPLVTYSLNRGASVGGSWDASAKVRVEADLRSERRNYQGSLLPAAPPEVRDRLRQASLSLTWSPRPSLQVNAAVAQQRRSGAAFLGNGNFKDNTYSVSATAQF